MSSSFLAISLLKQSPLPEKQLIIFLSHLSQKSLKEYLSEANIYNGKRNMSKVDLIDKIISNKGKSKIDTRENKLTQEENNNILPPPPTPPPPPPQIYAINDMIDFVNTTNIDTNKKLNMTKELKEIARKFLHTKKSLHSNSAQ